MEPINCMTLSDSDEEDYDDDDEEATGQDATTGDEDADLLGRVSVHFVRFKARTPKTDTKSTKIFGQSFNSH